MKRRTFLAAVPAAVTFSFARSQAKAVAPASAWTIHVGSADYPDFVTAIAAVPALRAAAPPNTSVTIVLPPGVSRIRKVALITAAHSGTEGAPLIIRGAGAGLTRLVGAVPLRSRKATSRDTGGRPLPPGSLAVDLDMLNDAPNLVPRGAYVKAPPAVLQLFQGEGRLTPSRWPSTGFVTAAAAGSSERLAVSVPESRAARWRNEPALWANGYWKADWAQELTPVSALAPDGESFRIEGLHGPERTRSQVRYCINNALSELREPGTFAADPGRKVAVYLPAQNGGSLEIAVSPGAIQIDSASNLIIKDISFDRTLGAAAVVTNSKNISFENCAFRQTGGNGVTVMGGRNVQFLRCVISETAETGIVLSGGDRKALKSAGHVFADGIVANFGLESPTYHPAAWLMGVGQRVVGSLLTGGAHNAVMLSGNDHQVVGNEISHVLRETDDAGAIYLGADWSERGILIARNYIHGLGGPEPRKFLCGIYLDDQASGAKVVGNVVVGGDFGIVIGGGRDNELTANLLSNPKQGGISFDTRGLDWARSANPVLAGKLTAVPVQDASWRSRYPSLANLSPLDQGKPDGNAITSNIASTNGPLVVAKPPEAMSRLSLRDNRSARSVPSDRGALASYIRALHSTDLPSLADRASALASLQPLLRLPHA